MPTARADSATTNANTAVKIAVLANDTGSSLKVLSITVPTNGTATINTDKTITYTPKTGYTGSDSFQYTIRDAAGKKATGTVSVTVRNQAPVAGADGAATDPPAAGFSGTDSFTYTVADGHGATAQGVVAITVQGLGEPFSDGTFFTDATGWLPAA